MKSVSDYLDRINDVLQSVLPDVISNEWLSAVAGETCLDISLSEVNTFVEPGRSLIRSGGKRWRPLITMLVCEALGGGNQADLLSVLTELPHNGSLIVDDIEDGSLLRRGGPAIHREFGVDLALNIGNLMYFLPSIIFDKLNFPESVNMKLFQDWMTAMRRLHLGQGIDIVWHRDKQLLPDRKSYLQMCKLKTGTMSMLAARLGAWVALNITGNSHWPAGISSAEEWIQKIGHIWENVGVGFQILDDVQNLSSGVPGKERGDDIREGKKSLPIVLHMLCYPEDRIRLEELFLQAAKGDLSAIRETCTLLEESGAIALAQKEGHSLLQKNCEELEVVFPRCQQLDLMLAIINQFISYMV